MSQTHLLRRNAVFYYHRRVPLPLVEKLGKKVILFSLGTKDPKEAKSADLLKERPNLDVQGFRDVPQAQNCRIAPA